MSPTDALKYLSSRRGVLEFTRDGCRSSRELGVRIEVEHHRHFFTFVPDAFTDHGWELIADQVRLLARRAHEEDCLLEEIATDAAGRRRRRPFWK